MLVAPVLPGCAVLNVWPAVAVVAAAAQLGVERVEGLDVEPVSGTDPSNGRMCLPILDS